MNVRSSRPEVVLTAAIALVFVILLGVAAAQDTPEERSKGIGPIEHLELGPIDPALATQGQATFEQYCSACHKFEERYVGPALLGVTERRAPEWIMNMILNPEVMIMEDPVAYELLAEYMTPMANQNLVEEQARAVLEYFRAIDAEAAEESGEESGEE